MSCVNSIRVIPESITIKIGELYSDVYAEVCPYEAECKEVCWHSEDTSIATVNPSSGYIYGKGLGTTRVYAAATDGSGCRDYITVNVRETVPVESITLNHTTISVECDKKVSLISTVKPSNASNKCISWTSSNNSVARVSEGIITGVSVGTAKITATATDGSGKSASCNVRVTGDILISSITVTPDTKTIKVGESAFLHTIVCPPEATRPSSVIWDSYNSVIASVNPTTGLVVGKHPGTTIIRAIACDGSGVCGSCIVTVVPVCVQDIVVSPETLILDVGKSSCLEATVYPVNATNPNISWTSGDGSIAEVDSNGCVTAKSAGTTYICANAIDGSNVYGYCSVTVQSVHISSVTINPESKTMAVGSATTLTAVVLPANATNKTIVWSSSDENIVTVDSSTGYVLAKNPGTTNIWAFSQDGSGQYMNCTITVNDLPDIDNDSWEEMGFKYGNNESFNVNHNLPPISYQNWILNGRQKVIYLCDHNDIPVVGHSCLLIRSSEGIWYKTQFCGKNSQNSYVECVTISEQRKNEYLEDTGMENLFLYGDYMESLKNAKEIEADINNDYNGKYDFFTNNCLHYVNEILGYGNNINEDINEYIKNNDRASPHAYYRDLKAIIEQS